MHPLPSLLWSQLGAATDMLKNAITACPDDVWASPPNPCPDEGRIDLGAGGLKVTEKSWHEFWYLASHTLFWYDYYLSEVPELFSPPAPFGREELDPAGVLPPRVYSKPELLTYLTYCRDRCRRWLDAMSDEAVVQPRHLPNGLDFSIAELLVYVTRHVQHHAAQLNLILRQRTNSAPRWVPRSS